MTLPSTATPSFMFQNVKWETSLTKLRDELCDCVAVAVGKKKLVVLGGKDFRGMSSRDVDVFDNNNNTWSKLPPIPIHWGGGAVAVINDHILFLFGGNDHSLLYGRRFSDGIMALDTQHPSSSWTTNFPPMPIGLSYCAAVSIDDNRIVVVGGMTDQQCEQQAHVYHVCEQTWSRLPNMHQRRSRCVAVVVNSKLYVIGGEDNIITHNTMEMFDFGKQQLGSWTMLPSHMKERRAGFSAVVVGDCIVVMGGHDEESLDSVEAFCTSTQSWMNLPKMSTERDRAGAALVGNRIVVVGGLDLSSPLDTMETMEIDPISIFVSKLASLMQLDLPLGLWPHVLAAGPLEAVYHIVCSERFGLDSILLHHTTTGNNKKNQSSNNNRKRKSKE